MTTAQADSAAPVLRGRYHPADPVAYGAPAVCPGTRPGETVTSLVRGSNADLMRQAAKLWITDADRLIDVTGGTGAFWTGTGRQPLASDMRPDAWCHLVADCTRLPYRAASVDVAVFDPPYQPLHGHSSREWGVGRSYALVASGLHSISDVLGLYAAGIAECARVLVPGTGRLLVKCQDLSYNHRLHLVHLDVLRAMAGAGVDLADMMVLANTSRMPQPVERQHRAHRAHSYLLIGVKAGEAAPGPAAAWPALRPPRPARRGLAEPEGMDRLF